MNDTWNPNIITTPVTECKVNGVEVNFKKAVHLKEPITIDASTEGYYIENSYWEQRLKINDFQNGEVFLELIQSRKVFDFEYKLEGEADIQSQKGIVESIELDSETIDGNSFGVEMDILFYRNHE